MTNRLIDTNVVSELKRAVPSRRVVAFIESCALDELYVSTVTLAEIRFGIAITREADRQVELEHWLTHTIRPMFQGRLLEVSEDVMLRWRMLVDGGRRIGRTYPQPDLILAATALEHELTVVTRNMKDFADLGLKVFNPWEA